MDRCPAEICTHIFSYACVDDGTTGRSLSLVSRYICQTSKPVRLQSVSVCGRKLHTFLTMLDNLAPDVKRVRHLFLSDVDQATADRLRVLNEERKVRARKGDHALVDGELLSLMVKSYESEEERLFCNCIIRILEVNAFTLRTLTLSLMHLSGPISFPTHLPSLVDLSLVSLSLWRHHNLNISDDMLPYLPSLKRLHVVDVVGAHALMKPISRVAPSLTHLRMTGRICDPFLDCLPNTVRKVFIQPRTPPPSRCGNPYITYRSGLRALLCQIEAFKEKKNSSLQVIRLEERNMNAWRGDRIEFLNYHFHDAMRDWRNVAEGGDAFWDMATENVEYTNYYQDLIARSGSPG